MRINLYTTPSVRKQPACCGYVTLLQHYFEGLPGSIVSQENPDIIHFWGCWNWQMAQMAQKAVARRIPYIFTPAEGLQPWNFRHGNSEKQLQATAYQRQMVREAACVHVFGPLEQEQLYALRWITRSIIIPNPVISNAITPQQAAEAMEALYRQTIEQHNKGIQEEIRQYVAHSQSQTHDISSSPIWQLLEKILYVKYLYQRQNIPLHVLQELCRFMTHSDYDESAMADLLKRQQLTLFTAQLEHAMSETVELTEGFMPIPSVHDKTASKIIKLITRYPQ